MKKYKFYVHGMHCESCVFLTESELRNLPHVSFVKTTLFDETVEVVGNFGEKSDHEIAEELTRSLKPHGYFVSLERGQSQNKWTDFKLAVPIAFGFAALFIVLQKLGIVNLVSTGNVTYGTAFIVGVIASLSTCMAVVGGLVLSMSATFAKEGDRWRPQALFHMGRLVSFFILGGVIGALGSAFTLNTTATFILGIIIALVMLVLGINLLDVFPWSRRLLPRVPKFLSSYALSMTKLNHSLTPVLVGIATFFLPCGFTQSMQLYTLSTGSFLSGGFTMLSFALGTLPVLALVSFSSFGIRSSAKRGVFFKSAGLIVILFALFNLINSLAVIGLIPPVFNI